MEGYEKLASLMSSYRGINMYRQFAALNAKNLLYMQAELTHLEAQLSDVIREDSALAATGDVTKESFPFSWSGLKASEDHGGDKLQYRLVMEIRIALDKYYAALLQQAAISHLDSPSASDHRFLQAWLDHPDGGNLFLRGREADPYGDEYVKDLLCVSGRRGEQNPLARLLIEKSVPWFHHHFGHLIKPALLTLFFEKKPVSPTDWKAIYEYNEEALMFFANLVATCLSALVPAASIFALYYVSSPLARLGTVMAFTIIFAVTLATVTKVRSFESFAATAA
ncbi:hypothetical protein ACLMJK_008507 [Lecanora helva]